MKNVATQKETNAAGPDNRSKIVLLVDASQQTGKAGVLICTSLIISCRALTLSLWTIPLFRILDFHLSIYPATL